jgi:hypothetical protein
MRILLCLLVLLIGVVEAVEAQDPQIECTGGICERWVVHSTMTEASITDEIANIDTKLIFLGNLPTGVSKLKSKVLWDMLNIMLGGQVDWDTAKQTMIDRLTAERTALQNRQTDSP